MAANDSRDSHFLFPDMFSFTFDPEILTFLWGLCATKAEDGVQEFKPFLPQSNLLQLFVPTDVHPGSFFSFLRYSFVTTGMVVVVSVTSYYTFKVLQKIRYEGYERVKTLALNAYASLKRSASKVRSLQFHTSSANNNQAQPELSKRPSNLQLPTQSNSSPAMSAGNGRGGVIGVPSRNISVTPINGEIVCGDEDVEDIQSQYFGPNEDTPKRVSQVISPYSPEFALRARYASMDGSDAKEGAN